MTLIIFFKSANKPIWQAYLQQCANMAPLVADSGAKMAEYQLWSGI
jgi:hypothetical protein